MKKIIPFVCLLLASFTLQAQFIVETGHGDMINDGDIISFNQVGAPSNLDYYITNTSSGNINMRIEFVSVQNADGTQMQLCITPTCYYSIVVGESYPQEQGAMSLPLTPGEQSLPGNHFMNLDAGNGSQVIEYVFKFYQVDNSGNEIGSSLTYTYRYDPNMGIQENGKMQVSVYPTVVEDMMVVNSNEEMKMDIYSLLGNKIKSIQLPRGENQVNMTGLASQVYLVRFENQNGDTLTKKVIVK